MKNYRAKFKILREKYPKFIYRNYEYEMRERDLKISFFFEVPPDIKFEPKIIIKNVKNVSRTVLDTLENLVFHLGLAEIPSYWKATCSPEIVIESGFLNKEQLRWWKDLIIKGMGQFFYENKIDWRKKNFLQIKPTVVNNYVMAQLLTPEEKYLVPMGGGKDSIVTLEKLKEQKKEVTCFMVNPTKAAWGVYRTFLGQKKPIIVERKIDPKLLELNKKGYLNGHTPFTALLSFLAVFCAVLFDYRNVVFSCEKSADEGNLRYLGRVINHQWSKSSEFEKKFKNYCKKYLVKNINYFSFLRKYTELEIAKMFSQYPKYFSVFSSCNRVAKKMQKRWCGECPKCLFTYLILCPFLKEKELLKIFGKNLLTEKKLLPLLKGLLGERGHKPFECVGTYSESKKAFKLCLKNLKIKK